MKKLFVTILSIAIVAIGATNVFATDGSIPTKEIVETVPSSESSQTDFTTTNVLGTCINNDNCTNVENCPNDGVPKCDGTGNQSLSQGNDNSINQGNRLNTENCPNDGIPKRDGTGNRYGGQGKNEGRGNKNK